ncbi:hypothetical protein ACLOJK_041550 [Asimina triloba]
MVAKKVRDSLPLKLCAQWKANICDRNGMHENNSVLGTMNSEETASLSMDDEWAESLDVDENEKLPEIYLTLKQSLLKAFKLMDKELKLHPTIDCFCSGTTAVTLVKQGQDLIIGNVGDSRAVLGRRDKDHALVAVQLTVDLKPNLPREAARIQQCKGRVFALQDEPEVARVWLPNNDSPGLAMARAFGDFCLKDYGLISVPDISCHCITERDEFVVLATDGLLLFPAIYVDKIFNVGVVISYFVAAVYPEKISKCFCNEISDVKLVWDVFSNKEVVDIVASAPSRATAARALVDSAVRAWRLKFPTSKADDCAVVCLFLDPPNSSVQGSDTALEEVPDEGRVKEVPNLTEKEHANGESERSISDMAWVQDSSVEHPNASQSAEEIVPVPDPKGEKLPNRCQSTRSLAECISTTEEEEWSALDGVTRVNSLVNLPRFGPGRASKAAQLSQWVVVCCNSCWAKVSSLPYILQARILQTPFLEPCYISVTGIGGLDGGRGLHGGGYDIIYVYVLLVVGYAASQILKGAEVAAAQRSAHGLGGGGKERRKKQCKKTGSANGMPSLAAHRTCHLAALLLLSLLIYVRALPPSRVCLLESAC